MANTSADAEERAALLEPISPGDDADARGGRLTRSSAVVLLLAVAALVAALAWQSRSWPLIQDPPAMHYVAWRMADGAVLYRDLFDGNFPGVYLLHFGLVKLCGPGDAAFRAFDLVWLAATALLCVAYCRRFGIVPGIAAGLMLCVFHLDGGPLRAGQRDYILVAFLIAAAHFTAGFCEGRRGPANLVIAGVLVGLAVTIKPFLVVYGGLLGVFAAVYARRVGRSRWAALAGVFAGGLIPLAAVTLWLASTGGLGAFVEILTKFLPLYARMRRIARLVLLDRFFQSRFYVALAGISAAPLCGAVLSRRSLGPRRALLLVGLLYGAFHYLIQGKGWGYHLYPLVAFTCLLVAVGLRPEAADRRRRGMEWTALAGLIAALIVSGFALVTYSDSLVTRKLQRRALLVADIGQRIDPGDTVQVMDLTYGGLDALLQLEIRQATTFLYDFHFYYYPEHPYIRALRARFLDELRRARPKLVVLFRLEGGWQGEDFDRVRRFQELGEWLANSYDLAVERDRYHLYQRRSGG